MGYFETVSASMPQVYWRLHELPGTTSVPNEGSSGITGTLIGSTTNQNFVTGAALTASNPYYEPRVPFSGAYRSFGTTGVNNRIRSEATSSLFMDVFNPVNSPNNGWTVECLAHALTSSQSVGSFWTWRADPSPYYGLSLATLVSVDWTSMRVDMIWRSGTTDQSLNFDYTTPGSMDAKWHHYALVWMGPFVPGVSPGVFTLFVDGVAYTSSTQAGTVVPLSGSRFPQSGSLGVGSHGRSGNTTTNAFIAEFAAYDRALSGSEILDHVRALNSSTFAAFETTGSMRTTVQLSALNTSAGAATQGSGADPRSTKTNPGVN